MIGAAAPESGVASNSKLILLLLNLIGSVGAFLGILPSHCDDGSPSSLADDVDTFRTLAALFGFVLTGVVDGYFHFIYSSIHTLSTCPFLLHLLHLSDFLSAVHAFLM